MSKGVKGIPVGNDKSTKGFVHKNSGADKDVYREPHRSHNILQEEQMPVPRQHFLEEAGVSLHGIYDVL